MTSVISAGDGESPAEAKPAPRMRIDKKTVAIYAIGMTAVIAYLVITVLRLASLTGQPIPIGCTTAEYATVVGSMNLFENAMFNYGNLTPTIVHYCTLLRPSTNLSINGQ